MHLPRKPYTCRTTEFNWTSLSSSTPEKGAVSAGSSMRNQRKLFTSPIRAGNSTEVEARVGWNFRGSVCPPPLLPRQLSLPGGARKGGRRRGTGEVGASFLSPPSSPSRVSPAAGRKLYRGPMMHRPEMARVVPGRKCGTYVRAHTCIHGWIAACKCDRRGLSRISERQDARVPPRRA